MIPIAHIIVPSELQLDHKHPTLEYRILGCFGNWKTPCAEIGKIFTSVRMQKAIHVCCFKKVEIGAG